MLRTSAFLVLAACLSLSVGPGNRSDPPALGAGIPETGSRPARVDHDEEEITQLVQQLGSDNFADRHAATERLKEIGYPALDALRAVVANPRDLETRLRARQLVTSIPDRDFQKMFGESVTTVEKILPQGWAITKTLAGTTPPDWHTDVPTAGFLVEASDGQDVLRIWFLPLDWIGIRKVKNQAAYTTYWQGILAGERYKTITFSSKSAHQEWVSQLSPGSRLSTPCLTNSGFSQAMKIFGNQIADAERRTQALIAKHCRTPEDFHEAAGSLVILGVPAKSVFLRAARAAAGFYTDFFYSTLGLMGGDDAIALLCEIVADARLEEGGRKYAVYALRQHQDPRIAPALHAALRQMRDGGEPQEAVVAELVHRRHVKAIPDVLNAFRRSENGYYKGKLAQALAAFRCKEVVPDLERWVQEMRLDPKTYAPALQEAELAHLRLTGDWGQPGNAVLLVPPSPAILGQKMELTIHEENTGDQPYSKGGRFHEQYILLNGKPLVERKNLRVSGGGRYYQFYPGEVHTSQFDLSRFIQTPGQYTVQCEFGEVRSAVVRFEVLAEKP
jgi:hypothetical protein